MRATGESCTASVMCGKDTYTWEGNISLQWYIGACADYVGYPMVSRSVIPGSGSGFVYCGFSLIHLLLSSSSLDINLGATLLIGLKVHSFV